MSNDPEGTESVEFDEGRMLIISTYTGKINMERSLSNLEKVEALCEKYSKEKLSVIIDTSGTTIGVDVLIKSGLNPRLRSLMSGFKKVVVISNFKMLNSWAKEVIKGGLVFATDRADAYTRL